MTKKLTTLWIAAALAAGNGLAQAEQKTGEAKSAQPASDVASSASATASHEQPRPGELHGGKLITTPAGNFETVFAADGIRVYFYTSEKAPAMVEGQTGSVMLKIAGGASQEVPLSPEAPGEGEAIVYFCPMHPEVVQMTPGECDPCGGMVLYEQNRLFGRADLSQAKPGAVTAEIRIRGLQGKLKEARFSATNAPVEPLSPARPKS